MGFKRLCRRPDWFDIGLIELMRKKLPLAADLFMRTIGYKQQLPDWSNINPDLLEYIQKKLPLADVFSYRSVCRRWRSTTKAHLLSSLNPSPPVLLLRRKYSNFFCKEDYFRESSGNRQLLLNLSLAGRKRKRINQQRCKRKINKRKRMKNSSSRVNNGDAPVGRFSHEWVVSLDTERRICMSNLSSFGAVRRLRFPHISCPPELYSSGHGDSMITKLVFWGNPILGGDSKNYGMVIICGFHMRLYFAKCGDTKFSELEHQVYPGGTPIYLVHDIICVNNRVYGVTLSGYIEAWDCSGGDDGDAPKKVLSFQPMWRRVCPYTHVCLVESQGELLLVSISLLASAAETNIFGVYKMDFALKTWVPVDSLGDRVLLFLCPNQAMFLSTMEFPSYERNSIYFERRNSIHIFNLEDKSLKKANP